MHFEIETQANVTRHEVIYPIAAQPFQQSLAVNALGDKGETDRREGPRPNGHMTLHTSMCPDFPITIH